MRYKYTGRSCRNGRCRDYYQPAFVGGAITGLCPSCRRVARWGFLLGCALFGLTELVRMLW